MQKRTQLGERYPTIPLSYHFTAPILCLSCRTNPIRLVGCRPAGRKVQNEPNSSIADCGLRIADWVQTCGGTPPVRPAASCLRRPTVQNEPNFAGRPGSRRARRTKRTQFPARPGGMGPPGRGTNARNEADSRLRREGRGLGTKGETCKTNPISRQGRVGQGLGDDGGGGQLCKTKPKDGNRYSVGGSRLYKQTQFARVHRAKRTRFREVPGGTRPGRWLWRAIVQNKPNLPPPDRQAGPIVQNKANCPKRGTETVSRLRISDCELRIGHRPAAGRPRWPRYPTIWLFYHSTIPVRYQLRETKPISHG